jgi:hypothetical protein
MRPPRIVDPRNAHHRVARHQYAVQTPKEVAGDLEVVANKARTSGALVPRITGQTHDDILRSIIDVLVRQGLAIDETTGPDVEGL